MYSLLLFTAGGPNASFVSVDAVSGRVTLTAAVVSQPSKRKLNRKQKKIVSKLGEVKLKHEPYLSIKMVV